MVRRRKKDAMNNEQPQEGYVAPELQQETVATEASATNDAVVAEVVTQDPQPAAVPAQDETVEVVNQVNSPREEADAQAANEAANRDRFAPYRNKSAEELNEMGVPVSSRPHNSVDLTPDADPLEALRRYREGLTSEGTQDDEIVG